MTSVSIVVPMRNEAGNIADLARGIATACADLEAYEIIIVDDGSSDETARIARDMGTEIPQLKLVQHPHPACK